MDMIVLNFSLGLVASLDCQEEGLSPVPPECIHVSFIAGPLHAEYIFLHRLFRHQFGEWVQTDQDTKEIAHGGRKILGAKVDWRDGVEEGSELGVHSRCWIGHLLAGGLLLFLHGQLAVWVDQTGHGTKELLKRPGKILGGAA